MKEASKFYNTICLAGLRDKKKVLILI
jgi:hypothetical protein